MPLKILIAEDEKDIAYQYKEILEERGHSVTVTYNGVECLNTYLREYRNRKTKLELPFDVVLVDYSMPYKDGVELSEEIRRVIPDQPIIFVTAHGNKVLKSLSEFEEGVEMLTKPFSLTHLTRITENVAYDKLMAA
jgi:CheY-like chemotaxis protein